MTPPHLNQIELARRWKISHRTLERWRWTGQGPAFLKIGGRVVYRVADVEAFEAAQCRCSGDAQTTRAVTAAQTNTARSPA